MVRPGPSAIDSSCGPGVGGRHRPDLVVDDPDVRWPAHRGPHPPRPGHRRPEPLPLPRPIARHRQCRECRGRDGLPRPRRAAERRSRARGDGRRRSGRCQRDSATDEAGPRAAGPPRGGRLCVGNSFPSGHVTSSPRSCSRRSSSSRGDCGWVAVIASVVWPSWAEHDRAGRHRLADGSARCSWRWLGHRSRPRSSCRCEAGCRGEPGAAARGVR